LFLNLGRFWLKSKKLKKYKDGVKTTITWETGNQVVEKLRDQGIIATNYPFIVAPEKVSIDYKIR